MSRIGKIPIEIKDIKCTFSDNVFKAENSKGSLSEKMPLGARIEIKNDQVIVSSDLPGKNGSRVQGLARALINNMIVGLTTGFEKKLEMIGVGYKANLKGKVLVMSLGFSHPVEMNIPEGITVNIEDLKITVSGINKQKVGQFAAEIREWRKPEPYKGKGIRYEGEYVRRKEGKRVAA